MVQNDISKLNSKEFVDFVVSLENSSPYISVYKKICDHARGSGVEAKTMFDIEMALRKKKISLSDELLDLLNEYKDDMSFKAYLFHLLIVEGKKKKQIVCLIVNEFNSFELYDNYSKEVECYLWSLGDDLFRLSVKEYYNEYVRIIRNRQFGEARQMIALLLGKIKKQEVVSTLIDLLDDDDINGHVLQALSKYDFDTKNDVAQRFLFDGRKWVAKIAKKML